MIVELFGGPGGWSEGLRALGLTDIALEWDAAACATRAAAGHPTIRADVATYPPQRFRGAEGLIASPPCPDWSQAGNGLGRDGPTGHLTDLVPRWVELVHPRWIACEQVPPALPVWYEHATRYRALGYRTWAGILNAANFGVPQTRRRAFLLASLGGPAAPPAPTHDRYGTLSLFTPLKQWVAMAEALGWHGALNTGLDWKRGGDRDDAQTIPCTKPAPGLTAKSGGQWHLAGGKRALPDDRARRRPITDSATTLAFGHDVAAWAFERPATTIAGDPRCWPPGHKVNADDRARLGPDEADVRYSDRAGSHAIRLTIRDALILQSFRPDYPVQGTKTDQFRQIGDAVPPLLAAHIIAALTGHTLELAA